MAQLVWQGLVNMPAIWGEGALFAFSGMDGETQTHSGFVATFAREPYGLLIHTPRRRILDVRLALPATPALVTGDVLVARTPEGDLAYAYSSWDTIIGRLPRGTELALRFEDETPVSPAGGARVTWDELHHDAVALATLGERFALCYASSAEKAICGAESALALDLESVMAERLATYGRLPALADPAQDRLLKKCWSVMRVNTLGPEGVFTRRWSTPDRVPHRHMWLWDSVFHTFGMNHIDPELSWDFLLSVLDQQREDGMIPHCMHVDGTVSEITQPPILAAGVWEAYRHLRDRERLAYALPRLLRYLEWNAQHRDRNSNGLLEWYIEENESCRSGESGMDNSQRFDRAVLLDAVDFSTFQSLDWMATARIARELGDLPTAEVCAGRGANLAGQIHDLLWDEEDGFYYDRDMDGRLTRVKAVSGFLPLLLADIAPDRIGCLVQALADPGTFAASFPIPSASLGDPSWSTDMWRGSTWLNMDYLVLRGLCQHGYLAQVQDLRDAILAHVGKYYEQYGVIFEFYDARDEISPVACDRKGERREPYDVRVKMDSIRDYHWSAALVFDLLLE